MPLLRIQSDDSDHNFDFTFPIVGYNHQTNAYIVAVPQFAPVEKGLVFSRSTAEVEEGTNGYEFCFAAAAYPENRPQLYIVSVNVELVEDYPPPRTVLHIMG